jgi:hypothetical protein
MKGTPNAANTRNTNHAMDANEDIIEDIIVILIRHQIRNPVLEEVM